MKNVLHRKKWDVLVVEQQVQPSPINLIKSKHNDKPGKDFVKIKFRKGLTSEKSDLCESKIDLFDNDNPEEFFFPLVTIT